MIIEVSSEAAMKQLGEKLGARLRGGEVIELVGDIGAGKTTFTKGLAVGLGISEDVQSPSFTISRTYDTPHELRLVHYDFYRLEDAGIMKHDIDEAIHDDQTVTIIEWGAAVRDVLPHEYLELGIVSPSEDDRHVLLTPHGERYETLVEGLAA